MRQPYRPKITTSNQPFKLINLPNIKIGILFFNVLECLLTRTRTTNRYSVGLCILVARLLTYYLSFLLTTLIRWLMHLCNFGRLTFHRWSIPHFLLTLLFHNLPIHQLNLLCRYRLRMLLISVFHFAAHLRLILIVVNICQIWTY